jgi:hypothetical protein
VRSRIQRRQQKRLLKGRRPNRSPAVLLLLLLVWSICLGWGIAIALGSPVRPDILGSTVKPDIVAQATPTATGTVDAVPARYQLGKELYIENCASCHVALPPEVLPTETWRRLLLEPQEHYGQKLEPMIGPSLLVMWDYMRAFSRPQLTKEAVPYRVSESRFFKALHPRVKFPQPVKIGSCVTCHPGASQFNYRSLTSEWENSP